MAEEIGQGLGGGMARVASLDEEFGVEDLRFEDASADAPAPSLDSQETNLIEVEEEAASSHVKAKEKEKSFSAHDATENDNGTIGDSEKEKNKQIEEEEEDDDHDDLDESDEVSSTEEEEDETWISWFCSMKGNEFFCEVDPDYIEDRFNMYGLPNMEYSHEAMDMILDLDYDLDDEFPTDSDERASLEVCAEILYGIIHSRYILSPGGMRAMYQKFLNRDFGECLRIDCERQPLLPIGLSDVLREQCVKSFCPRCREIYLPTRERQRSHDGAFWGRTFPNLFLLMHPEVVADAARPEFQKFMPRIFGFRIHESSPYWKGCKGGTKSTAFLTEGRPPRLQETEDAKTSRKGKKRDFASSSATSTEAAKLETTPSK